MPVIRKETPEERDERISLEVAMIVAAETNPDDPAPSAMKPNLDYYDNVRDTRKDGSPVHYQGRYGKFRDDQAED